MRPMPWCRHGVQATRSIMITYTDRKDFDHAALVPLFEQAPWACGRTVAGTMDMVQQTDLFLTAWDDHRLIGCGRVLTDYVYRASIWDVVVDPMYQGQDIGSAIIHRLLTHPTLQRVELFWLCTRDKQAFYESLGFSAREQTGMVWDRKKQSVMRLVPWCHHDVPATRSTMVTCMDRKDFDHAALVPLFEQSPWACGRTVAGTMDVVQQTDLLLTAWDDHRLIGCGRVLTDYVYRASIWDVVVDPMYQGQDIGSEIIHRLLTHPTLQLVELFWLCTCDKQAFYERLGFSAREQTGMVWNRKKQSSSC